MLPEFRCLLISLEFPVSLISFPLSVTNTGTATLENRSPIKYKIILNFKIGCLQACTRTGFIWLRFRNLGNFPGRGIRFSLQSTRRRMLSKRKRKARGIVGAENAGVSYIPECCTVKGNNDFPFSRTLTGFSWSYPSSAAAVSKSPTQSCSVKKIYLTAFHFCRTNLQLSAHHPHHHQCHHLFQLCLDGEISVGWCDYLRVLTWN